MKSALHLLLFYFTFSFLGHPMVHDKVILDFVVDREKFDFINYCKRNKVKQQVILPDFFTETSKIQTIIQPIDKYSIQLGDTVRQISENIMVIYQAKNGNYWLGSWQDGLYKYDGKFIIHFTTSHGLLSNRIEEINEDKFGNVLINTYYGLCKYDNKQIKAVPETLPSNSNWTLQADYLWFKSTKLGYVCCYDGESIVNLEIPKSKVGEEYLANHPNLVNPYAVYCIYKDGKGNVWFGTAMFGVFRFNGKSFDWISEPDVTEMHSGPSNGVRSILEDKDGFFWFNTGYRYRVFEIGDKPGELFYDRQTSIGNLDGKLDSELQEYLSIARDTSNCLWLATYRNGVWKYDGNKVVHYSVRENDKDINLFYIYIDHGGSIWLGTHENGLWKYDGETFVRFKF